MDERAATDRKKRRTVGRSLKPSIRKDLELPHNGALLAAIDAAAGRKSRAGGPFTPEQMAIRREILASQPRDALVRYEAKLRDVKRLIDEIEARTVWSDGDVLHVIGCPATPSADFRHDLTPATLEAAVSRLRMLRDLTVGVSGLGADPEVTTQAVLSDNGRALDYAFVGERGLAHATALAYGPVFLDVPTRVKEARERSHFTDVGAHLPQTEKRDA